MATFPFNMLLLEENDIILNIQKLLEVLHGALPKMSLIASDFSYLPEVKILGERAPLVSTKVHSDPCVFNYLFCSFSQNIRNS